MATQTFNVTGMTCGHCAAAVTEELSALEGVDDVTVDLGSDAPSTVTVNASTQIDNEQVAAALDEAGDYQLV